MPSSSEVREIRVVDVIAQRLARETRFAFGVPGGEVLSLIDALRLAGTRFVLARHESSAGFMAEGALRSDRWKGAEGGDALGVLVATLGPGVANCVNVVSHAQQSRQPLVVLTGCVAAADAGTYTHQVFDHVSVLRPLVKASFVVAAGTVGEVVERAIALAKEGVPGVVHIEVPVDVADQPAEPHSASLWEHVRSGCGDHTTLSALRHSIQNAKRPLLLVGLGALAPGAAEALREVHARCPLPVVTSYEAKGVVDEHDPRCVGAAGLSPRANAIVLPLVRDADVVVLVGFDPVELRHAWRHPFAEDATIIELARGAGLHGMFRATSTLVGDPATLVRQLFDGVAHDGGWSGGEHSGSEGPEVARKQLRDAFPSTDTFEPTGLIAVLEQHTPPEAIVCVDTGAHRILICQQWRFREPARLVQSNGTSTMACALGFAAGAKIAEPQRPVLAVIGDGGLEMALGELGTFRDEKLPVMIVVFDDRSLALIEKKQRARDLPNLGVDFGGTDPDFAGTDYAAIARAFGGVGVRIESLAQLQTELAAAFAEDRDVFTLLHCPIPRHAYDDRI